MRWVDPCAHCARNSIRHTSMTDCGMPVEPPGLTRRLAGVCCWFEPADEWAREELERNNRDARELAERMGWDRRE